jgi:hypothetical protein
MLELAASGLLGSIFGGIFRLAPEVLKFFDRKEDRKHELAMFQIQTDLEKMRGQNRIEERYVDHGIAQQQAIQAAFVQQGQDSKSSYKWVAALSALVRPLVTYILFLMYVLVKFILVSHALSTGMPVVEVAQVYWTTDDFAMLMMILTFWFLGRPIEKYIKQS